jgi:hypothetical protein
VPVGSLEIVAMLSLKHFLSGNPIMLIPPKDPDESLCHIKEFFGGEIVFQISALVTEGWMPVHPAISIVERLGYFLPLSNSRQKIGVPRNTDHLHAVVLKTDLEMPTPVENSNENVSKLDWDSFRFPWLVIVFVNLSQASVVSIFLKSLGNF